jgi:hypothetical protein
MAKGVIAKGRVYIANPATHPYTPPPSSIPVPVFSPFLLGAGHYLFYLHSFIRAELIFTFPKASFDSYSSTSLSHQSHITHLPL